MLPVVAGCGDAPADLSSTRLLLVPLAVVPAFTGLGGVAYLVCSVVLGAVFLGLACQVYLTTEGREADTAARQLFGFSILYLFVTVHHASCRASRRPD